MKSYTTIPQIFDAFTKLKVLIIGDVMVDAYIWGTVDRISPEAPVPVMKVTKRDYRLGGAANVALNVQALGATPILCAVTGADDHGRRFAERLQERGLTSEGIVTSHQRPTTVKTRVMTTHQHIVRVDEEVDAMLRGEEERELWERIQTLLQQADVVIFEDYNKGTLSLPIIEKTIALANQNNIPTVVDPKKANFLSYKGVTLFKPNFKELKEGLNLEINKKEPAEVAKAVDLLITKLGCQSAMVTLSEQGVYIKTGTDAHHIPAHIREIADVSGAGDTVISIAALCVALGLSPHIVASLSNLGGGLVCEHIGVVPVDREGMVREATRVITMMT